MPRPWNEIDWSQPRPSVSELISSWPRLRWEPRTPESPALGPTWLRLPAPTPTADTCWANGARPSAPMSRSGSSAETGWTSTNCSGCCSPATSSGERCRTSRSPRRSAAMSAAFSSIPLVLWSWTGCGHISSLAAAPTTASPVPRERPRRLRQLRWTPWSGAGSRTSRVDITHDAWTPWFHDVAWDSTYVLTDLRNAQITVLCVTDTD